jgi:tetratricopeptide (TPR) repeat protein
MIFYIQSHQTKKAWSCAQQLKEMTTKTEERADLMVRLGCIGEQMNDFAMAESFYRDSLRIGERGFPSEYWANNNLGFCLNQLGRPAEAQPYLVRAITLDPTRSNAFKNLGLCYQGLERLPDAVDMFIEATRANAADDRSVVHLEDLVKSCPALFEQVPDLDVKVKMCRAAVDNVRLMQPDFDDWWKNRRAKQGSKNEDQT